jgi:hypothetical protein
VVSLREFNEPNPFNPPGSLCPEDTTATVEFDLVQTSHSPFVQATGHSQVAVHAFTDLKRQDLNDAELNHFANEQVPQGRQDEIIEFLKSMVVVN